MRKAFLLFVSFFLMLSSGNDLLAQESNAYLDSLVQVREILLSKNPEGEKATNINLMTIDGEDKTLYDFDSELTLLYLYHPDCYACMATIQYVKDNPSLKTLIDQKRIKILAVDLTPDMISLTENMLPPKDWTLCINYDGSINSEFSYYIEEYPSIYLMDKDKIVLKKNPSAMALLNYLEEYLSSEKE